MKKNYKNEKIRIEVCPDCTIKIEKERIPKYFLHAKIALILAILFVSFIWFYVWTGILEIRVFPFWYGGPWFVTLILLFGSIIVFFIGGGGPGPFLISPYFYYTFAKRNYKKYVDGLL